MNTVVEFITNSESQTCQLAGELSNYAGMGEFFGLIGDLGTGKSVFARAFLRTLANDHGLEVPSPTFTLVQSYDELRIKASHFDLYRITDSAEVDELGLEDALVEGIVLVEWPDRLSQQHVTDCLMITFEDSSPHSRKITLAGQGIWAQKLIRWQLSSRFLKQAGWGNGEREFLQGDASHRRYERIKDTGRQAILMDMAHRSDGPVIAEAKPYSELAHLAQGVGPFITMTRALQSLSLSAPEIIASQTQDGFLLLEDLGPENYFDRAARGKDMMLPLHTAVDVLVHLAEKLNGTKLNAPAIPTYDRTALQIEVDLLPDWYWRRRKTETITCERRQEFRELWRPLWQHLEQCPRIWTLRDYHSPNLIWLPQRKGVARVGLVDYQDAVLGAPAYDLVSLLQDARRDVPRDVEVELYEYYWQQLGYTAVEYDRNDFDIAYAILGAQRATKILGIFARLADRDNKPGYLAHIPRVRAYLERNLEHGHLEQLRHWFDRHLPMAS